MTYSKVVWHRISPDLEEISEGLTFLGVRFWKPRMLFKGAPDKVLKKVTGEFPARKRSQSSTHPIFVLDVHNDEGYHRVCPCTSRYTPGARYIPAGCILDQTLKPMARTSFLLEKFAFNLPFSARWIERLRYMGTVPQECLKKSI